MTSSVLSIWYPIYRELDRPNSFSKLSTHFDFPRRSGSHLFRETVWQKACTIKSPMKDPLSFIGLFCLLHAERLISAARELEDP